MIDAIKLFKKITCPINDFESVNVDLNFNLTENSSHKDFYC